METALDKRAIISSLTASHHGNLKAYAPAILDAGVHDAEFLAHLVSWNHVKGEVRDARLALPVLALATTRDEEYVENALAHLADLNPRALVRALAFAKDVRTGWPAEPAVVARKQSKGQRGVKARPAIRAERPWLVPMNTLRRLVLRYLRDLERGPFDRFEGIAVQHRKSLQRLYSLFHVDASPVARKAILQAQGGTPKFDKLRSLAGLPPVVAAATVVNAGLPFLVARGALGRSATDPDVLLALVERMSATELVTSMRWLEAAGVKRVPSLRAALEAKLAQLSEGKKKPTSQVLKATRAAEAMDDEKLAGKLHQLQERQLERLATIEGDWLVLGDRSGSMHAAIETARQVAGILARMAAGRVYLVFFNNDPAFYDVTKKTYEEITRITRSVSPSGGTSIGCGLATVLERGLEIDGIAIVSDGGENQPVYFADVYGRYKQKFDREPSVYFYRTAGDPDRLTASLRQAKIDASHFDLTGPVDYSSLPNIVKTMRVSKYRLVDEIMAAPTRRLDQVLDSTKGMEVWHVARTAEAVGR